MSGMVFVGANVPADVADRLRAMAAASDRSVASLVRLALREMIEREQEQAA